MPVVRGIKNPVIVQAPEYPPSDESLHDQALKYIKENKPKMYKEFLKDGDLEEFLTRRVRLCKERAEYYLKMGIWENRAWDMAIREILLESEPD